MPKKIMSILLSLLLVHAGVLSGFAQQNVDEGLHAARVKQEVTKRGTGEKAGVKIKLRNHTEFKGYVSQVGANNFVLVQEETGTESTLAYTDVAEVKGKGMSKMAKIGIGLAAVAAGAVTAFVVGYDKDDFGLPHN
jgi:hypothetical protein